MDDVPIEPAQPAPRTVIPDSPRVIKKRQRDMLRCFQRVMQNPRNADIDWPLFMQEFRRARDLNPKWQTLRIVNHLLSVTRRATVQREGAPPIKLHQFAESAFDVLPVEGPSGADILWVRTHPLLFRLRQGIKRGILLDSVLTVDDIANPSNGPAPSKQAVTFLQECLLNPSRFWFFSRKLLLEKKPDEPKEPPKQDEPEPPKADPFGIATDEDAEEWSQSQEPTG